MYKSYDVGVSPVAGAVHDKVTGPAGTLIALSAGDGFVAQPGSNVVLNKKGPAQELNTPGEHSFLT